MADGVAAFAAGHAFLCIERQTYRPMLHLDYCPQPADLGGSSSYQHCDRHAGRCDLPAHAVPAVCPGVHRTRAQGFAPPPSRSGWSTRTREPRHKLADRLGTAKVVSVGLLIPNSVLIVSAFFEPGTVRFRSSDRSIVLMAYGMGNIMDPATDAVMRCAVPGAKAMAWHRQRTMSLVRSHGLIGVAVIGSVFNSAYSNSVADAVTQLPPDITAAVSKS